MDGFENVSRREQELLLKKIRKKSKSVTELCRRAGCARSTYYDWVQGVVGMTSLRFHEIAEKFGISAQGIRSQAARDVALFGDLVDLFTKTQVPRERFALLTEAAQRLMSLLLTSDNKVKPSMKAGEGQVPFEVMLSLLFPSDQVVWVGFQPTTRGIILRVMHMESQSAPANPEYDEPLSNRACEDIVKLVKKLCRADSKDMFDTCWKNMVEGAETQSVL